MRDERHKQSASAAARQRCDIGVWGCMHWVLLL